MSHSELETYKLAIRTEVSAIVDFKIDFLKQEYEDRFLRVDNRLKELGLVCKEILPASAFKVSLTAIDHLEIFAKAVRNRKQH